jgi:hypothetical protein
LQSDDIYQDANISKEFWINVLLDNKSDNERFLSRHAILHGEDINYGNYEKSLILIIAMDAVLEWLNIFSFPSSSMGMHISVEVNLLPSNSFV